MSEWIKCSDRLPEEQIYVIATNGQWVGKACISFASQDKAMYFMGEEGVFSNEYGLYSKVTHWMPLPERPVDL